MLFGPNTHITRQRGDINFREEMGKLILHICKVWVAQPKMPHHTILFGIVKYEDNKLVLERLLGLTKVTS